MAVITDIKNLSQTAALNGPDGAVDPPSTLDDQMRYLGQFIAQLRDQVGFTSQIILPGVLAMFAGAAAPAGWLLCNGVAVSRTTYAALFAVIGGTYGTGDGSATFNIPNLQGAFARGLDNGRGLDPGRALGSYQDSGNLWHGHGVSDPTHSHVINIGDPGHTHGYGDPGHTHAVWTGGAGGHNHGLHDPGHAHGDSVAVNQWGLRNEAWAYFWITQQNQGRGGTAAAGTGMWIDGVGDHTHGAAMDARATGINIYGAGTGIWANSNGSGTGIAINGDGLGESRPRNVAVNYIIKT